MSTNPQVVQVVSTPGSQVVLNLVPPPAAPRLPVGLGGYNSVPGAQTAAAWGTVLGRAAAAINWYQDIAHSPAGFDAARATEVVQSGAVYHLSWELDDYTGGALQPLYNCDSFTEGEHDTLLVSWLQQMATWGHTDKLLIRPFWEMSGRDYPWATQTNGNSAGKYIDAWRHLVDLARRIIPKARFVWCPSVDLSNAALLPMEDCYPGHGYVDVLSLDGYNKGALNPGGVWWSFEQVFSESVARISAIAPSKPLIISETGCHAVGGDKAAWYTGIASGLANLPQIDGLIFFTTAKPGGQDYSLTDPAVAAAVKSLAGQPLLAGTF